MTMDKTPPLRNTERPRKCGCGKSMGVVAYKDGERFYCSLHCCRIDRDKRRKERESQKAAKP